MTDSYNRLALAPGSMIRDYRLFEALGMGSFGIVYLAKNEHLDRTVAIKEFLPAELATRTEGTHVVPLTSDREDAYQWALERFRREAKILWDLSDRDPQRSVVRVTDFVEAHGTAYMVMHYEQGESLSARLEQRGTLPEAELTPILEPLLDGLEIVHQASVWHRDIKPANIMVREDGSPVLVDFGAAHMDVPGADRSIMAIFSPAYAAPEQVYGGEKQGPWTDIYSLGATLYRAATGNAPTNASDRLRGLSCPLAVDTAGNGYSPNLLRGIDAALALRPQDRPQSIAEWRRVFSAATEGADSHRHEGTVIRPANPLDTNPPLEPKDLRGPKPPSIDEVIQKPPEIPKPDSGSPNSSSFAGGKWILLGLLALVATGVGWWVYSTQRAHDIVRRQVEKTIESFDCAKIDSTVGRDFSVLLSGTVSSDEALSRLRDEIQTIDLVAEINLDGLSVDEELCPTSAQSPSPQAVLADVKEAIERLNMDCAKVHATIDDDLAVQLSGFVSSFTDVSRLQRQVQGIAEVSAINIDGLSVHERPFCEMVGLLQQFDGARPVPQDSVQIHMNDEDLSYSEGEFIVVTVTASRDFDGYLYVDYLDSEGNIVHLLPSPAYEDNAVTAGETVTIGTDDPESNPDAPSYKVAPPHGLNMIIAISSRQPLFDSKRPEVETLESYLPALRGALEKARLYGSSTDFSSHFEFMTTHE